MVLPGSVVKPLLPASWAAGLDEVIARRDELVVAGRRRVEAFTSRRSGEALLGVFARLEEILGIA